MTASARDLYQIAPLLILDLGECKHIMKSYLDCIKKVKGVNEDECRMLAKSYLGCRMDRWVTSDIRITLLRPSETNSWTLAILWLGTISRTWDLRKRANKQHQPSRAIAARQGPRESSGGNLAGYPTSPAPLLAAGLNFQRRPMWGCAPRACACPRESACVFFNHSTASLSPDVLPCYCLRRGHWSMLNLA